MIALAAHPRILVVALRRLGDVLLTTPLIRSLKRAWPDAAIDVLVFRGTEGILEGNPDIATSSRCPSARPQPKALYCCGKSGAPTILRSPPRAATGRRCSLGRLGGRAPGLSIAPGP
jgi:hypothetical protein